MVKTKLGCESGGGCELKIRNFATNEIYQPCNFFFYKKKISKTNFFFLFFEIDYFVYI